MGRSTTAGEPENGPHPDLRLARLAAGQHGVVTRTELAAIGIAGSAVTRRVKHGRLWRLHRGVYAVGHPRPTSDGRRLAAALACGSGAVVSHRDAAALWKIWEVSHSRVEVTSARRSLERVDGVLLHRVRALDPDMTCRVRGIPVTSVARTLVDLADVVGRDRLARAMREADYLRLLDLEAVESVVARSHGRRRLSLLDEVLRDHRPGTVIRSELEHRFLQLCRTSGLPAPETNVRMAVGRRRYELDCLWRDQCVVVELDGSAAHATPAAFETDRARDSALVAAGFRPLRFTWRRVTGDPAGVASELSAALAARMSRRA